MESIWLPQLVSESPRAIISWFTLDYSKRFSRIQGYGLLVGGDSQMKETKGNKMACELKMNYI